MNPETIESLNARFQELALEKAFEALPSVGFENMALSTAFGQEGQVLTDIIFKNNYPITVFTLDTGRLFEETYQVMDATQRKYKKRIISYVPDTCALENLIHSDGALGFYESIEKRKACCATRKIEPLKRALKDKDLWITGLRAAQSEYRASVSMFQYDTDFEILKFNPLVHWDIEQVETYLVTHQVPQNPLHKKGYPSIGCAPCTRAVHPGQGIRSGRWWWEKESKRECGLHQNLSVSKAIQPK